MMKIPPLKTVIIPPQDPACLETKIPPLILATKLDLKTVMIPPQDPACLETKIQIFELLEEVQKKSAEQAIKDNTNDENSSVEDSNDSTTSSRSSLIDVKLNFWLVWLAGARSH